MEEKKKLPFHDCLNRKSKKKKMFKNWTYLIYKPLVAGGNDKSALSSMSFLHAR